MTDSIKAYAYLLECADGSLYAGWTMNPQQRLEQHNLGKGAKYTRSRLPVILKAVWQFNSKQEAMRFEWQLKQMSRTQKLKLIAVANAPGDNKVNQELGL